MPTRHHTKHKHLHNAFSDDYFGNLAEKFARFFGTPRYMIAQTIGTILWVALNLTAFCQHWDPYPFILLNLAYSIQAGYAAPLILCAQTRQADRDKAREEADARHREEIAQDHGKQLAELHRLTRDLHVYMTEERKL